jgi:CRP-like cAMP-binding protein
VFHCRCFFMFEQIKEAFSKFTVLSPKDLIQIASIAKVRMVKQDEHLVKIGDLNYNVAMVLTGMLRHYAIDEDGTEKTLLFIPEKRVSTMIDTIFHNNPSTENIVAMESSIIVKFDFRALEKLALNNIRLLRAYNQALKEVITLNVEHIKLLNLLVPEERYKYFCKTYPELEQRVKQKYLASFLGITPTSLSRIRGRVVQE